KTGPNVCPAAGAAATVNNGVTLAFNGCMLEDGGRLDGTVDVQATRTPSDTSCGANTSISVAITTTITNLTYLGPRGRKLVIPNQTGTSSFTFMVGQAPTLSALNINGRMQIFGSNGTTLLDNMFTGSFTVTPNLSKTSYSVDGMLSLQDQLVTGATTTINVA